MMARRSTTLPDTSQPTSHLARNLWILVAVLVVIAVSVSVWYAFRPAATTVPPTASASPTVTGLGTGLANGCLAGPGKSVEALIAAQKVAPHTTLGAVELAASFVRWYAQYPWPSAKDATAASTAFAAPNASPTIKDLSGFYSSRATQTASGTGGISMVKGKYFIQSGSPDLATIVIGGKGIEDGVESPTRAYSVTVSLVWDAEKWKIVDAHNTMDVQELFDQGTPFAGGC